MSGPKSTTQPNFDEHLRNISKGLERPASPVEVVESVTGRHEHRGSLRRRVGGLVGAAALMAAIVPFIQQNLTRAERKHSDQTEQPHASPAATGGISDKNAVRVRPPLGDGLKEDMRKRADNLDFVISDGSENGRRWEVMRMNTSQTAFEKARFGLHNLRVGTQTSDPRLADLLGPDARRTSDQLGEQYGAYEILPGDSRAFSQTDDNGTLEVRGPVAMVSVDPTFQALQSPEVKDLGAFEARLTFVPSLGQPGKIVLTGMELGPYSPTPNATG